MIIEYSRVRPDAKPPQRANPSDAGLDLFYNPPEPEANVRIEPGQSVVLETGLRVGVPHGYMLEVKTAHRSQQNKVYSLELVLLTLVTTERFLSTFTMSAPRLAS